MYQSGFRKLIETARGHTISFLGGHMFRKQANWLGILLFLVGCPALWGQSVDNQPYRPPIEGREPRVRILWNEQSRASDLHLFWAKRNLTFSGPQNPTLEWGGLSDQDYSSTRSLTETGSGGAEPGDSLEGGPQISPEEMSFSRQRHRFWVRTNFRIHGANLVAQTLDYWTTRRLMKRGYREMNPLVRPFATSDTAMAAYSFGLSFGGILATSYMLHRTGHHRWERFFPAVALGSSGTAVALNLRYAF